MGVKINTARDQTFGQTCASAPGSALCGEPLSKEFIGPPMAEVRRRARAQGIRLLTDDEDEEAQYAVLTCACK